MGGPSGSPGVEPGSTAHVVTQSHGRAPRSRDREAELRDYRAAFAVARSAMALIARDGVVLAGNGALGTLLGTSPERMNSLDADALLGLTGDQHVRAVFHEVAAGRRDRLRCTRRLTRPDGSSLRAELTLSGTGGTRPLLLTVEDVGERDALREQLRHLRMHDPVTRLPNRALFFERLAAACEAAAAQCAGAGGGTGEGTGVAPGPGPDAGTESSPSPAAEPGPAPDAGPDAIPVAGDPDRSPGPGPAPAPAPDPDPDPNPDAGTGADTGADADPDAAATGAGTGRIGLCYLNLDGFKAVNDTLGHRIGDELLAAVAGRLLACAKPGGHLVARLGGDEFALLLRDSTGTAQATALAESVLAAFQQPFDVAGHRLAVSASIGVVEREAAGTSPTGLMQAADTTLYWAKADGKARWTLFDPERNEHRMTRQALSRTLRQAVERGEFVLDYQPLVALDTGELRGVEALVRWEHPHFGRLSPGRFIGLAEEDGSIVQLGRWVLAESCRQARAWQRAHPRAAPVVSVNVAVRQVWDSDLVADVAAILAETGLPPRLLQLELTESAVMGSAGRPLQVLHALHEMGVRIAIDDFGTGYSNLAYMSRLPVSALKLDGSFVQGFRSAEHPNPADETIVEALVQLAHRLGLTVTAECVESAEQAERLRRIGCDTGQGWHWSRPVGAEAISRLLA